MAGMLSAALQRFWKDTAAVFTVSQSVNSETGLTEPVWEVCAENIPCKLSFSGGTSFSGQNAAALNAAAGDPAAEVGQGVKLFCAPDVDIPPGSRVTVVRQNGMILQYESSGLPLIFSAHQEIRLRSQEKYA